MTVRIVVADANAAIPVMPTNIHMHAARIPETPQAIGKPFLCRCHFNWGILVEAITGFFRYFLATFRAM